MPPVRTVVFALRTISPMRGYQILIEGPEKPVGPNQWANRSASIREAEVSGWRDIESTGDEFTMSCDDTRQYVVIMGLQDGLPKVRLVNRTQAKMWLRGDSVNGYPAIQR